MNLLPIPILDGGQIVFQAIEWLKGSPLVRALPGDRPAARRRAAGAADGRGAVQRHHASVRLISSLINTDKAREAVRVRACGARALATVPLCALRRSSTQSSSTDFTVSNIRVEGLQRISEGTVFNYLPVNIGDHLTPQRVREAMRALYATGFFRDVELRRDGDTLVVAVAERPSIESIDIKGNKDIKTEDLQKSLRNVGLAAGKTFDRSTLDEVTQYLTDQYYSRGKYAVQIDTKVEDLPDNRVRVNINIKEGSARQDPPDQHRRQYATSRTRTSSTRCS